MIVHVRVRASSEGFRVEVPESRSKITLANLMWIDTKGLIHGFGDEVPDSASLSRVAIYDPTDFNADRTFAAIQYFTLKAWPERPGLMRILQLFDRFEWDMRLQGYEAIPNTRRSRFESEFSRFVFARGFAINGRYRRLPPNLFRLQR